MTSRNSYESPPLHHPVPQHISVVPHLRSPPPPHGQHDTSPYEQHGHPAAAPAPGVGQYTQFVNDPAAQVAAHLGQNAFKTGQAFVESSMSRYFSQRELEHYFNVSEIYVFKKLFLLLFPWRQGTWTRQAMTGPNGPTGWYLPPRDDVNSPDLYIPAMAWPTYVLLCCFVAGLRGEFQDALMGYKALQIFLTMICELGLLKLAIYLFGVFDKSRMVELVAYSGYKMVGVCLTLVATLVTKQGKDSRTWLIWVVFIYTYLANSYFLMRSLRYVLLPENSADRRGTLQTESRQSRTTRNKVLFCYSFGAQLLFTWFLSRA